MIRSTNSRCASSCRTRRAPVERLQQEAAPHLEEPPGHDVVEHAHALEEGHVLEGARHPEGGHVVGPEVGPVAPLEADCPARVIEAADHVEQRGLARPVGADDRHDLPARDLEAHPRQGLDRPEAHADLVDLQQRGGAPRRRVSAPVRASPRARTSRRRSGGPRPARWRCGRPRRSPAPRPGLSRPAAVERLDQRGVLLGDEAAAHLAGAGDLLVVRVELLVEQQEAPDLRAPRASRPRAGSG